MTAVSLLALAMLPGAAHAGWYQDAVLSSPQGPGELRTPEGIAFAADGSMYVADMGEHRVLHLAADGTQIAVLADAGSGAGQVAFPTAIAVRADGDLYVADAGNQRIDQFRPDGRFVRSFGGPTTFGTTNGQVQSGASDVAVAPDGSIWATDASGGFVRHFAASGAYLGSVGTPGSGAGQLQVPSGLTVLPDGTLLVADYGNDRVVHFDAAGAQLGTFGSTGAGNGQFHGPSGIVRAPDGTLFVSDRNNYRLQKFAGDGTFIAAFSSGWVCESHQMAVGLDGNLYVTSPCQHHISSFHLDTSLAGGFGAQGAAPGQFSYLMTVSLAGDGRLAVVDQRNHRVQLLDTATGAWSAFGVPGSGLGQLQYPQAGAVASDGTIYVADENNHRVNRYAADGTPLSSFGSAGVAPGQFTNVNCIAVGLDDVLYVSDYGASRIQRFDRRGTYLSTIATAGSGPGQVNAPACMDVAPDGSLWIADSLNHRIEHLAADGAFLGSFGSGGTGLGSFSMPEDVKVAADGTLFVSDTLNGRVQHLRADGTPIDAFGTYGVGDGSLYSAANVLPMADGTVYVADTYAHRLVRWREDVTAPKFRVDAVVGDGSVHFHVEAADAGAGLDRAAAYSFDGGATFQASPDFVVAGLREGDAATLQVVVRDAAGNATATSAVTARCVQGRADVTGPTVASPGAHWSAYVNAGQRTAAFTVSDPQGVREVSARFQGRAVPVASSGELDLRALPEGRGTLQVTALDASGNATTWQRPIVVDRTPPQLQIPSAFAFGPVARLGAVDAVSGLASPVVTRALPRLGSNALRIVLRDRAGNVARRTIVLSRHLSLARPQRNADLRVRGLADSSFRPLGDAVDSVFRFQHAGSPWYDYVDHSPPLVREVQWRLKRLGFMAAGAPSSGMLDITTIKALKRYQHARSIPPIATVGPLTRAALDADLVRATPLPRAQRPAQDIGAPHALTAPSLAGAPQVGVALEADPGTWAGATRARFAFQWQSCAGVACTNVDGAHALRFVPRERDAGATLRIVVTATSIRGAATAGSDPSKPVLVAAPANLVAPSVRGVSRVGSTLVADGGAWRSAGTPSYAYQWRRCDPAGARCASIAGATGRDYVPTVADRAAAVRVSVTASNAGGATTATSIASAPVTASPPTLRVAQPAGSDIVGDEMASVSAVSDGATATYQWQQCDAAGASCADIAGATAATFVPTAGLVGKTLRLRMQASSDGGSVSATSPPSPLVWTNVTAASRELLSPHPRANDFCGQNVAVGDVNGDGRADIVSGCYAERVGDHAAGGAFVYVRNRANSGYAPAVELADPFPPAAGDNDYCGVAVAVGDVNGDGRADIVMGCPEDDHAASQSGVAYLYMRRADNTGFDAPVALTNPAATDGGQCGRSLAMGDVNGDGKQDIVVGCDKANSAAAQAGAADVYVRDGSNSGFLPAVHLTRPAAQPQDRCGWSVAAGDVNGDGRADVAIGCSGVDDFALTDLGETIVFVRAPSNIAFLPSTALSDASPTWYGFDACGYSLAMGDVNADGRADVVTGCGWDGSGNGNSGAAVVYERTAANTGFDAGQKIHAPEATSGDRCGWAVAVGDVDGDGRADVALGCPFTDVGVADTGAVSLFRSQSDGSFLPPTKMALPTAQVDDECGSGVAVADLTGDGRGEVIVGCPYRDPSVAGGAAVSGAGSTAVLSTASCFGTPSIAAYDAAVQADAPRAFWHLDDAGATSVDATGGSGNAGTYAGGVGQRSAGVLVGSKGAFFDGANDQVSLPPSATTDLPGAITIEAWIRPLLPQTDQASILIERDSTGGPVDFDLGVTSSSLLTFWYHNGAAWIGGNTTVRAPVGSWSHVAVTRDAAGANIRIYLDGKLAQTMPGGGPGGGNGANTRSIGADTQYGPGAFFHGSIQDVAVYATDLSQPRLQAHFDAIAAPGPSCP